MKKGIDNFFLIVTLLYIIFAFSGAFTGYVIGNFINNIVNSTVCGFFIGISVGMIFHYILLKINKKFLIINRINHIKMISSIFFFNFLDNYI